MCGERLETYIFLCRGRTSGRPRPRELDQASQFSFFFWIFIDRAFTTTVRNYYWFCRETQQ